MADKLVFCCCCFFGIFWHLTALLWRFDAYFEAVVTETEALEEALGLSLDLRDCRRIPWCEVNVACPLDLVHGLQDMRTCRCRWQLRLICFRLLAQTKDALAGTK